MGLLLYHILPSVVSGLVFTLIVSLIIFIFRIKNPSFRALIYILVLFRGLEAFFFGGRISQDGHFGVRYVIFDPTNVLPFKDAPGITSASPLISKLVVVVFLLFVILVVLQWFKLYAFYRQLSAHNYLQPGDHPAFEKIVSKYAEIFAIKRPKIALSTQNYSMPALVGFFNPTIVISPKMIDFLDNKYLEIIIAHEMAHAKRRDNIFHWLAVGLRDLSMFNPASHIAFKKFLTNKEISADALVLAKTSFSGKEIKKCLDKVLNFEKLNNLAELPSGSYFSKYVNTREKWLNTAVNKKFKISSIGFSFIFIFLLLIQVKLDLPF